MCRFFFLLLPVFSKPEKAFNASALPWQLIYNTRRSVVQIWPPTRSAPAIGTSKTSTSIRCRSFWTTWWGQSRTRRTEGCLMTARYPEQLLIIDQYFLCRYLEYFIGLLSGDIKINSLPVYLRFIKMESPPCLHHKISHHENEWSSFLKIFEGERFVFISGRLRKLDLHKYFD